MKNHRASVADIATAMSITRQAIKQRAKRDCWPFEEQAVRGGRRRLYDISSLPARVQEALAASDLSIRAPRQGLGGIGNAVAAPGSTPEARTPTDAPADLRAESLAASFESKPDKLKGYARERLEIVAEYHRLLARGFDLDAVVNAVTFERQVSASTLTRYLGLVRGEPEHLWLYLLCPAYTGRTATAEMSAPAWEFLKADYLRAERPSASACIYRLKRAAPAHGWSLPSERTMVRRLNELPRAVKVMARDGKKAALQLYPAQARSRAALSALAIINGDGYLHNLWVAFPDGEIRRAKSWFWQDVYSSKILGFRLDKTEHTDVIRLSFKDLAETYGIPEAVLLDNTMAAANKVMSGGIRTRFRFKVREEEPLGVFPLLGCEVKWATPGHGQAKPIERVFGIGGIGELVDKAPEFSGAWTGGSPLDKPDYDGKAKTIQVADLEAVIVREVAAFNAKAGRRSPMHRGRSFDDVFNESYSRAVIRRLTSEQLRMLLLATEGLTVGRDGTITLDSGRLVGERLANRYWSADLVDHAGRKVAARFDPKRLHEGVHVYTLDGRYIAFADCVDPAAFNDQNAAREHQRNRKGFMRATKARVVATTRMDALEAAKFMPGADSAPGAATVPAPKVVRPEFRDPIERPRVAASARSAEERAAADQLEQEIAAGAEVNVHELRSDADKNAHWKTLDQRRAAGEVLLDAQQQFWKAWQDTDYFRLERDMNAEFERGLQGTGTG